VAIKVTLQLRRAMVYGSVLGSFTVEKFGLDRLRPPEAQRDTR